MPSPSITPNRLRAAVLVPTLFGLLQVTVGVALVITLPDIDPMQIEGSARCTSGALVQGIWVEGFSGGSNFATMGHAAPDGSRPFTYQLPYGGRYQVHVGCGGTPAAWGPEIWSPYVDGIDHAFVCHDVPAEPEYDNCTT